MQVEQIWSQPDLQIFCCHTQLTIEAVTPDYFLTLLWLCDLLLWPCHKPELLSAVSQRDVTLVWWTCLAGTPI